MKICSCGYVHQTPPEGGINDRTGYYFQCQGGCNSTLFIPSEASRAKIAAAKARKALLVLE